MKTKDEKHIEKLKFQINGLYDDYYYYAWVGETSNRSKDMEPKLIRIKNKIEELEKEAGIVDEKTK